MHDINGLIFDPKTNRDIVDTEPHDGNVLKMLVGSINKWFDGDENHQAVEGYADS